MAGAIGDRLGRPRRLVKFDETAAPLPQLVIVRLVHDHVHDQHRYLRGAAAPARLPPGDGQGAAARDAGGRAAAGMPAGTPAPPLLDPFCGSGTIPIEAALLARRIAPGKMRRFAFMDWPGYDR